MAAGDFLIDSDGNWLVDSDGNWIVFDGNDECPECCETGCTCGDCTFDMSQNLIVTSHQWSCNFDFCSGSATGCNDSSQWDAVDRIGTALTSETFLPTQSCGVWYSENLHFRKSVSIPCTNGPCPSTLQDYLANVVSVFDDEQVRVYIEYDCTSKEWQYGEREVPDPANEGDPTDPVNFPAKTTMKCDAECDSASPHSSCSGFQCHVSCFDGVFCNHKEESVEFEV